MINTVFNQIKYTLTEVLLITPDEGETALQGTINILPYPISVIDGNFPDVNIINTN